MKAFWYQCLLIGIVLVLGGCVDPRVYMSLDVRLHADGYPPEYIDGLNAGCEAFCRELSEGKTERLLFPPPSPSPYEISRVCSNINLNAKSEQKPRDNRSYQQGWADGKALVSFAIDAVRQADAQIQMQAQAAVYDMKFQRVMELGNASK